MQGEHDSNIFCLDFDFETKNVFSGGNDERVLIHDIETSKFVNQYLQEEPVFGISCHPGKNSDPSLKLEHLLNFFAIDYVMQKEMVIQLAKSDKQKVWHKVWVTSIKLRKK